MTYSLNRLTHCTDVSPADWIGPRLTDWSSGVTSVVPSGFPAYVRIVHAPRTDDGGRIRWSDVAAVTGRVVHPLMQWHAIATGRDGRPDWSGDQPDEGTLDEHQLPALIAVLKAHTSSPDEAYHALWNGFGGWAAGSVVSMAWSEDGEGGLPAAYRDDPASIRPDPIPPVLPPAVTEGPLVELPNREYFLFRGPVDAAADFETTRVYDDDAAGSVGAFDVHERQTPQLIWPADRAWCVATEIDFDSTLVGASQALVDAILADHDLEAFPVPPDGDLTYRGDLINDPGGRLSPY